MYHIVETIENAGGLSFVAEVSFHPSGSYFAATYEHINEVRIFDSQTRKTLQVLRNPESQLDGPHGLLLTEKYLLVANNHGRTRPGSINVYPNSGTITKPIRVFQSPFAHLHEPHSLAMRGGRLVMTYCDNVAPSGAIVSYGFNDETGTIVGPLDKTESWFSDYGDCKGVCFSADGTKIITTFESDKQLSIVGKVFRSLARDKDLPISNQLLNLSHKAINKIKYKYKLLQKDHHFEDEARKVSSESAAELELPNPRHKIPNKNGIATFSINAEGKIARSPEQVILPKHYCRLENVDLFDNNCAITDLVNHSLFLYNLDRDPEFTSPVQTINLGNSTPHGAKFSPDGRLLVVSCLGVKIVNQEPHWETWASPREDKIFILERATRASRYSDLEMARFGHHSDGSKSKRH